VLVIPYIQEHKVHSLICLCTDKEGIKNALMEYGLLSKKYIDTCIEESEKMIAKMFSERSNFSLEFCIDKYGETRGYEVWKARNDLWQNTLKSKSQSEIDLMNSKKGITLERMIEKYGKDEGTTRYNSWLGSVCCNNCMSSMSANRFFIKLYKKLRRLGIISSKVDVYLGVNGSTEYFIRKDNKIRFYDFTIPSLKVIIEYNGVAFHAREGDHTWRSPYGRTYEESINNDMLKFNMATEKGFDVFYVWSDIAEEEEMLNALMFIIDKT